MGLPVEAIVEIFVAFVVVEVVVGVSGVPVLEVAVTDGVVIAVIKAVVVTVVIQGVFVCVPYRDSVFKL